MDDIEAINTNICMAGDWLGICFFSGKLLDTCMMQVD